MHRHLLIIASFLMVSISSVWPLDGDFNVNGRIDIDDFFLLADSFGSDDTLYDLNGDGIVNFDDVFRFADIYTSAISQTTRQISPSGNSEESGTILFLSRIDGVQDIYSINPDGTGLTKFLSKRPWPQEFSIIDFSLSESGTKLVASLPNRHPFIVDFSTSQISLFADTIYRTGRRSFNRPTWSPDGRQIAFNSHRVYTDGIEFAIVILNEDKSEDNAIWLPEGEGPTWSPDGQQLAYSLYNKIIIRTMNDGSSVEQQPFETDFGFRNLAWSPNGQSVAFSTYSPQTAVDLYVFNLADYTTTKLTDLQGNEAHPTWSPDGKYIAFDYEGDIYTIRADGTELTPITNGPSIDFRPAWISPSLTSVPIEADISDPTLLSGLDLNLQNIGYEFNTDSFFSAASKGDTLALRLFIEAGMSVNSQVNPDPKCGDCPDPTALHRAAQNGHIDAVKLLLESGANPNMYAGHGAFYPLMSAANEGYSDIVQILIQYGAHVDVINLNDETALFEAIKEGHSETVSVLLDNGADPTILGSRGTTTLMLASEVGNIPIIELLLEKNVPINAMNLDGETALFFGVHSIEVTNLLLERGADPHIVSRDGETPFIWASSLGTVEVLQTFINYDVDIFAVGKFGSALFRSISRTNSEITEFLLVVDLNPNAKNSYGLTPLIQAIRLGNIETVRLLLQYSANPNEADSDGNTPLFYAVTRGSTEIANLLQSHGAICQCDIPDLNDFCLCNNSDGG